MTKKRIIKKYPNRRLYDTGISRYITLEDVKKLVMDGVEFTVTDVKTNEDLTRAILMQIISEQEHGDDALFSANALTRIILSYGKTNQYFLSDYLSRCLDIFEQQQLLFQEHARKVSDSIGDMSELTERNLKIWRKFTDDFFRGARLQQQETDKDSQ